MEICVSNIQIFGAIDGIRSKLDALMEAITTLHPDLLQAGGAELPSSAVKVEGDASMPAKKEGKVKRKRAKSRYNAHMSAELARLKDLYPEIGHRRRFAMAVASWKQIQAEEKAARAEQGEDDSAEADESDGSGLREEGEEIN